MQPASSYDVIVVGGGHAGCEAAAASASVMDGLMDLDYGTWQMRTHDEIRVQDPDSYKLWHTAPHLMRFPKGEPAIWTGSSVPRLCEPAASPM